MLTNLAFPLGEGGRLQGRSRCSLTDEVSAADNVRILWITFSQREVLSVPKKPLFTPPQKKKRMSRRPVRS